MDATKLQQSHQIIEYNVNRMILQFIFFDGLRRMTLEAIHYCSRTCSVTLGLDGSDNEHNSEEHMER